MKVNGCVEMHLTLNVYDLETEAVEQEESGRIRITDPDQFFLDWDNAWNEGTGELLGASEESAELEREEDEWEDEEDEEDDDNEDE